MTPFRTRFRSCTLSGERESELLQNETVAECSGRPRNHWPNGQLDGSAAISDLVLFRGERERKSGGFRVDGGLGAVGVSFLKGVVSGRPEAQIPLITGRNASLGGRPHPCGLGPLRASSSSILCGGNGSGLRTFSVSAGPFSERRKPAWHKAHRRFGPFSVCLEFETRFLLCVWVARTFSEVRNGEVVGIVRFTSSVEPP